MTTVSSLTNEELLKEAENEAALLEDRDCISAAEFVRRLARRLRQAEADLRTVTAERDAAEEALLDIAKAAVKLPRPWMDGGVTQEDWFAACDLVLAARSRQGAK
ncbi:MAG TPA: hypothetical protein VEA41_21495 [Salinarimonas sp.]|nr:hypothetical protein [Salinarimonas sp.]